MSSPENAPKGERKPARRDTETHELVVELAREILRRDQALAGAPPAHREPTVPRATRRPWSRRRRPAGLAPTFELIRSIVRGERTRQQ